MDDAATTQTLTHLINISGFLREIAGELRAINQRAAAREARKSKKRISRTQPKTRHPQGP